MEKVHTVQENCALYLKIIFGLCLHVNIDFITFKNYHKVI